MFPSYLVREWGRVLLFHFWEGCEMLLQVKLMTAHPTPDRTSESAEKLANAAAQEILQLLQTVEEAPFGILLSGGRTPFAAYEMVSREATRAPSGFHAFFSDARMVPFDSHENNAHNSGFDAGGAPDPRGQHPPCKHCVAPRRGGICLPPRCREVSVSGGKISLGLIGLGADGHMASLFSNADIARGKERIASDVSQNEGPQRVTVTPNSFSAIDHLLVLVSGREKDEIVRTMREKSNAIPAGLAVGN